MRYFFIGLMALGLQLLSVHDAEARRGASGYSENLEFVTATEITGQAGTPLSLCVLVRTDSVLFIDVWRSEKGYALAENRCEADSYVAVEAGHLSALKEADLIPASIPDTPSVKTGLAVPVWVWVALAGLMALAALKAKQKAGRKAERRKLMGDASPAVVAILDAMCHAAKADGQISPSEVAEIAEAAAKMTGETIDAAQVAQMAQLAEGNLSESDFKRLVAGRSAEEHEVMMKGVLFVSAADGVLDGEEKQFIGKLAGAMKMPGETIQALLADVVAQRTGEANA